MRTLQRRLGMLCIAQCGRDLVLKQRLVLRSDYSAKL